MQHKLAHHGILASGGLGGIASLGVPLVHFEGDNRTMRAADSLVYTSLTNAGSLGGTADSFATGAAVEVTVGTRTAPQFRGRRYMTSSLTTSAFVDLHNGTGDVTFAISFYLHQVADNTRAFSTADGSGTGRGISMFVTSGKYVLRVGNGATLTDYLSTVVLTAGRHTATIRKSGDYIYFSIDGETEVEGTIISASATNPQWTLKLGNGGDNARGMAGYIEEVLMYDSTLTEANCDVIRTYFADGWDSVPDYNFLAESADVRSWIDLNRETTTALAEDQSGYSGEISQATSGDRPTMTTINGLDAYQGAAGKYVRHTGLPLGQESQPTEILCAFETPSSASGTQAMYSGVSSSNRALLVGTIFGGWGGFTDSGGATWDTSTRGVGSWLYDSTTSEMHISMDGQSPIDVTSLNFGTHGIEGLSLMGYNGSDSFLGKLGVVVIFAGELGDRTTAMGHLESTYDVTTI